MLATALVTTVCRRHIKLESCSFRTNLNKATGVSQGWESNKNKIINLRKSVCLFSTIPTNNK
jgi:hypothetical protein